ncbi:NADP-dependent malic enzyme, mitochondrial isoform X2 [Haemorhous mexicanus]|uniref:NADP-dependent malic enzyme, mitochondrial isoform X2 n=1 Tax=Haemorhous mexicanus TaxID=30427 RepID=UPI0028BD9E01|nr:NADP-dependent malic enzyme, mitochondrial isoform X2 [Haemorhous mexicanus]
MVPVCGGVCARRLLRMVGAGRGPLLLALTRARSSQAGCTAPASPGRAPAIKKRGYDITRNPHLNKGMAFTLKERLQLGIHGLLPPCFLSPDVQLLRVMKNFEKQSNDLDKYIILMTLQDRNEKLFYRLLTSDIEKFMPIVYTPTVGLACQQYGLAFRRPRYGMNCLIQFEDFANANAFRLLNKYRNRYCTFNDDIQGTASVAVAGLIAALRITKNKLSDQKFVFQGAGEAAMGIGHLILMAMEKEGISREDALKKIWMVDSKGLIVKGRSHLNHEKEMFAQDHPSVDTLEEVVQKVKPTAVIGVAAVAGAFTEKLLKDMAAFNERPIVFALSNPTSKAECTAEQCYRLTQGRGIFASGSPFPKVTLPNGQTFFPGQGNNAYVFPGVALGVIASGVRHISDEIFLITAETIAAEVTEQHLAEGRLYPPLDNIREVSLKIAVKIADWAYKHGLASSYPEPADKEAFVRQLMYSSDYDSFVFDDYRWPPAAMQTQRI